MKESQFVQQNKEKWQAFEQGLKSNQNNPNQVSKLFVQITDDLSYAQTFYASRSVTKYLNGVVRVLFGKITNNQRFTFRNMINFWRRDLPRTFYACRRPMLVSFLVFVACFTLGVVTSWHDPTFAADILGSDYVSVTKNNIEKKDPMGIYASAEPVEMFVSIAFNNLVVLFRTFIFGIFMSLGSLIIMVYNGVMVGVFQYFFIERDLFWKSFLSIWTHGTLEISTIIMSGGAGLTLGKGILFPGTYSRFLAFRVSARQAMKIMIGITPMVILAAFIESFLTRHTDIPDAIRFGFILLSFAFVIAYFFWYPRKLARSTEASEFTEVPDIEEAPVNFKSARIYTGMQIFATGCQMLYRRFACFFWPVGLMALSTACLVAINPLGLFGRVQYNEMPFFYLRDLTRFLEFPLLGTWVGACLVMLIPLSIRHTLSFLSTTDPDLKQHPQPPFIRLLLMTFMSILLFSALLYMDMMWTHLIAFLVLPFFLAMIFVSSWQRTTPWKAAEQTGTLLHQDWVKFFGLMFRVTLITGGMLAINQWIFKRYIIPNLVWGVSNSNASAQAFINGTSAFVVSFSFFTSIYMMTSLCVILYFSLKETFEAGDLITRIKNIRAK